MSNAVIKDLGFSSGIANIFLYGNSKIEKKSSFFGSVILNEKRIKEAYWHKALHKMSLKEEK